ncbi:hypothetical protein JMA_34640 [Jeotgalibacillus malaysiensis]|uniref:Uncharacterized protein n=1 Tax=Jeotgalibacillus malaysiensis TaxID=1508404 RepID=A0A0B5ART3_9BACL|nr:hypothetical protein JMA_34640 [Jeotgalibacillus malaysiensis]
MELEVRTSSFSFAYGGGLRSWARQPAGIESVKESGGFLKELVSILKELSAVLM